MSPLPPDAETLEEHVAFVRSVARATLAGDAEFEDVAQDVWVAALRRAPHQPRSLRAWLARVTRRQAALKIRRRTRERTRTATIATQRAGRPQSAESAADAVARAETGRRLVKAVLELPEMYRSVLLLRYQEGLPPRTVAQQLDLPVETVRTRTRRGLLQLREQLEATEQARGADWRASLLLLLPDASFGVSTFLGSLGGVVLMKKSLAFTLVLVGLLGAATLLWQPWSRGDVDTQEPAGDLLRTNAASAAATQESGAELKGRALTAELPSDGAPQPVDLSAVDRERDLHGTVRDDATGKPVAGARLELIEKTWARSVTFDATMLEARRMLAATHAAADGTWRIRLEPGDAADLHVDAVGYAQHRVQAAQAGERLDLRLTRGTELRVRVLDARGQVLPNASVRLFQVSRASRDGHGFPTLRGETDADGIYAAAGFPPEAAVTIDVSHPRHGSAMWREARAASEGSTEVEVTIPASRTLRGRVTDARTNAPISGARVGIGWLLEGAVETDAHGDYELPGWTAQGVYNIAVRAKGYAQDESHVGTRSRIDFALAPEDRIRGRVVDAAGKPVPGTLVSAVGSSRESGRQVTSSAAARADEDGRFEVRSLRHDMPHRLILVARGYGRTLYDFAPPAKAAGTRDVGDVRIAPAGMIDGIVSRPDGTPLPRVAVQLEGGNADRESRLEGAAALDHDYGMEEERYSDDLGRFRFRDIAAGTYTVTGRLPGGNSVRKEVVLAPGASVARVTLHAAEGRRFTVRVEDTAGTPVDQAMVYVRTTKGGSLSGSTDAAGNAQFEVLGEPTFVRVITVFELSRKRYLRPPEQEVATGAEHVTVKITPAEPVRGRVLDEQGKPLASVALRALRDGKTLHNSWTRRDGSFQLTVPAGALVDIELEGTRLVDVGGGGLAAKDAFISGAVTGIKAGADAVLIRARTVPLTGTITVKVTDPAGRSLPDATVYVNGRGSHTITTARTTTDGSVLIKGLPVAELTVLAAQAPGARDEDWVIPARVRLTPRAQSVTLSYRVGARVAGIVVNSAGEPVREIRVVAEYEGGAYHATSDAKGRFEARVPADEAAITVYLEPEGEAVKRGTIEVRPGDVTVRLVLP